MKKLGLLVVLAMMLVLAACGNSSDSDKKSESKDSGEPKTVEVKNNFTLAGEAKDGSEDKEYKDTVKVPVNPKKAVVFDYGTLDTMKELGLESKVAALPKGEDGSSLPDFLSEYKADKYENTGSLKEVNYDAVAKVKPDVIYLSARTANQQVMDELKKAAPKAAIVYMGANYDNYVDSMKMNAETLGKIYDKADDVKKLNEDMDKKIADMKAKTKDLDKKAMYLLVNEGELSTYGAGDRFGSFVYDTLGFKPADDNVKSSGHGQNVTNEYVSEKNPDIIFAMDRGQAIGGKSTAKQVLGNDVIKDVNAIKKGEVVEVDPKLWYFASGSVTTTMKQIDELEKGLKLDK
ncbi:iron ABC transporter substrate-binding protein [Staphylococcus microti]|uniref:Iron ABC transporter substrate-binding protein n=1 Tax=Staphylococcus microti TaxID=569857 RepID=A0A0D6XNP8_9STAP|nr:siderophore ABC transporter substrate-binding protein [Staphylococcus microti]KIX90409.1 iron ABC transporter substrate-binding protein [Staphylococcus microti]PNZ84687.1 iron ABC transporter substrate-binding protein [Staphylococcus microti]SUM58421.1 lipoprotein SstD [Staphylococcus microti]